MAAQRTLVALDARCTRQMSVGMKRYARELTQRLPVVAPDLEFIAHTQGENFGVTEQMLLPLRIAGKGVRLAHHLSLYAPIVSFVPRIVTIHDLIHLRYPEHFKRHVGPYYRFVVKPLLAHATRIITDDERTVTDLERYLAVDARKVRVIPLGVDEIFLHPDFQAEDVPRSGERPYLLYAGNHRPHKDLRTLVSAWAGLPEAMCYDLVLTGSDDLAADLPRRRPNGARLFFVGELSDQALARCMHVAAALVYPSLCEGFGLPMLEALAVGTTVIASEQAVPGILKEHCTLVPAGDRDALRDAIIALHPASQARRDARRNLCRKYTWQDCAVATADCYREVLEEHLPSCR